jgi:hypothetical protein
MRRIRLCEFSRKKMDSLGRSNDQVTASSGILLPGCGSGALHNLVET